MSGGAGAMPHDPAQQVPPKKDDDNEIETNPIKKAYDKLFNYGAGAWIIEIVILGLSAGIVSKKPGTPLRAAAGFNLALAALHFFFIPFKMAKPVSATNPRPKPYFIGMLAFSTLSWIAAAAVMFAMRSDEEAYVIYDARKKRGIGDLISVGNSVMGLLENITIACGCMGIAAAIIYLLEWWILYKLYTRRFTEQELVEGYEKIMKDHEVDPKKEQMSTSG